MRIKDFGFRIARHCALVTLVTLAMTPELLAQDTPVESASPTASASAMASPVATSPARNVRISFLPPPLDGTISLGIYDSNGQLVRVLHQQARLDDFTVGADALVTKWDGKDDDGMDLPAGKYHARGFTVGSLKLEDLGKDLGSPSPSISPSTRVQIKLMANPLVKNERAKVELDFGFDDQDTFLKSADGLPLYVVSEQGNVTAGSIVKNGDRSMDVYQDDGTGPQHFRISNVDKMMAFDCGDFELK
jgi:hypothetical protein